MSTLVDFIYCLNMNSDQFRIVVPSEYLISGVFSEFSKFTLPKKFSSLFV